MPGRNREFVVQSLINVLQKTQQGTEGFKGGREKGIEQAISVLQKFV
ncbi:hypothetical protein [Pantoea sp. S62]|nr:hypothetical protein [Pantoea sp. S62]